MSGKILPLLLTVFFLLRPVAGQAGAVAEARDFNPVAALLEVEQGSRILQKKSTDLEALDASRRQIDQLRVKGARCIATNQAELARINQSLEAIGPETGGESNEIALQRQLLAAGKADSEKRLAECRLLVVRADDSLAGITALQLRLAARRLYYRQRNILSLGVEIVLAWRALPGAALRFLQQQSGLAALGVPQLLLVFFAGLAGLGFGVRTGQMLARFGRTLAEISEKETRLLLLTIVLARYLPALVCLAFLCLAMMFLVAPTFPPALLPALGIYLFILLAARVAIIGWLTPQRPGLSPLELAGEEREQLAGRLQGVCFLFATVLLFALYRPAEPAAGLLLQLGRTIMVTLFCMSLFRLSSFLFRRTQLARSGWSGLLPVISLVLLCMVAAEWLGYLNLTEYLLQALAGTFLAAVILRLARSALDHFFGGLAKGRYDWQKRFRKKLGIGEEEVLSSLIWLKLLGTGLIWAGFFLTILRLWGISKAVFDTILFWLFQGLNIGNVTIVPARIVLGLLLFGLLWTATRWLRAAMARSIAATELSQSAREATVTIAGYAGFIVSLLIGLSVAGMNFANLTIIAGALSVGIGFGLQNIVNNFVSGLILLFERPIRRGDWVVVGETEGYVKKISVRSTIISTFDRADVIVPNSELISSQVTNWMLSDQRGRLRVAVGVAYGSDTALVKKILLEVASAHPEVVTDGSVPKPFVLFMEFGDSSLNFELRCFLHDIDNRLLTRSELNFAIDQAFREQGIQIPFPQRDLHVRDWPEESPP